MMFELTPRLGRSSFFMYAAGINAMDFLIADAVRGEPYSLVQNKTEAIWASVPRSIIAKYVEDGELKDKALCLIKEKGLLHTLRFGGETSVKRKLRIESYYFGQARSFRKYFFNKNNF